DTEALFGRIRKDDPESPRRLRPAVDGALETIVVKCLEKEPLRRYVSAEALADDLARWRRGEPVQARSPGWAGRLWRRARRRPVLSAVAVLIALAAAAVLVIQHLSDPDRPLWAAQRQLAQKRAV